MARETKIGMVVGIGFIVCFAIVLSHRGQLTGVQDSSGFEIESLIGDTPPQTDTDKIRQTARRVGDSQPTTVPRRQKQRQRPETSRNDERRVANSDRSARGDRSDSTHDRAMTDHAGRPTRDSGDANRKSNQSESSFESSKRYADVPIPADHMPTMSGTDQSPRRFGSRREPIEAKPQSAPKSRVVDLKPTTTYDPAPANKVNSPRPESLAGRSAPSETVANNTSRSQRTAPLERTVPRDRKQRADDNVAPIARIASQNRDATPTMSTQQLRDKIENNSVASQRETRQSIGEHKIEPGDTLVRIARRYYQSDDPAVVQAIFDANRDKLKSPDRIVTNRRLLLPAIEGTPTAAPERRRNERVSDAPRPQTVEQKPKGKRLAPPPRDPKEYYKIQSGDTLGHIAQKHYGTARPDVLALIQKANPKAIPSLNRVIQGRQIVLPDITGIEIARATSSESSEADSAAEKARPKRPSTRATVASAPASEDSASEWRWYELQKGDLYSTVASRMLGSSARWSELAELNRDIFPDPDRIRHGVRIRVPVEDKMVATTGSRKG